MCIYCKQDKYGSKTPFGLFDSKVKVLSTDEEVIACSAFIYMDDEKDDIVRVSLNLFNSDWDDVREVKINYCPMCGRKLNG